MRILIISRHTYPMQSPRAFRTAELSEELSRQGHEVVLYTVQGDYDYSEYERTTGIHMKPIITKWATSGSDGTERYNFGDKLLYHLFHRTLLFPDCEFRFLVPKIIKDNPGCDVLITIAVPHTIHMGAARAKKKEPNSFPKLWIADCGDPFFMNPYLRVPRYFEKSEREWCELSDYITIPVEAGRRGYFPEYHHKIKIIPQGFDFSKTPISAYTPNNIPTFAYAGALYGKRNPIDFIRYLSAINNPFIFYLYTPSPVSREFTELLGDKLINITGKTRKECIYELSKMDFLVNFTNPSTIQSPSKLIDYGISKRPVIDINIPFDNSDVFMEFLAGNYKNKHQIENLMDYRIDAIAAKFLSLCK